MRRMRRRSEAPARASPRGGVLLRSRSAAAACALGLCQGASALPGLRAGWESAHLSPHQGADVAGAGIALCACASAAVRATCAHGQNLGGGSLSFGGVPTWGVGSVHSPDGLISGLFVRPTPAWPRLEFQLPQGQGKAPPTL